MSILQVVQKLLGPQLGDCGSDCFVLSRVTPANASRILFRQLEILCKYAISTLSAIGGGSKARTYSINTDAMGGWTQLQSNHILDCDPQVLQGSQVAV